MDAIALLKEDHKSLRALCEAFAETSESDTAERRKLLARIETELGAHTAIEEELFYPALLAASKDVEDERMVAEGIEEHRAADGKVIPDLHRADPSTVEYTGMAKVLKDYIFHHLKEEETDMFPRAKKLIDRRELRSLGDKMVARKNELLGHMTV
ncbi:MAG: hemerythrin domain-containing protein [Alphaproteobacteria bacterium]|nr:hemerythrin domain-containing protein [Alphaproteobacteria bacterium]